MKKAICLLLCAGAMLWGGAAYGAGASASDPLVSLEYVTGTYLPSLMDKIKAQITAAFSPAYDQAAAKVAQLSSAGSQSTGTTGLRTFHRGDLITVSQGGGILLAEGSAKATAAGGEIVDATTAAANSDVGLTPCHRYLVGENAAAAVTVVSDTALFFLEGSAVTVSAGQSVTPFTDLTQTDWYYAYAVSAYQNGLLTGVSTTGFSPNTPVTRAMLATILYRVAGKPAYEAQTAAFADVSAESWYAQPVGWAAEQGVVHGMGDGQFLPDGKITREQLAQMLWNYASSYRHQGVSQKGSLTSFRDQGKLSPWAGEAVTWAVGVGILTGRSDGTLDPGGSATRAETAAMLQRFLAAYPE